MEWKQFWKILETAYRPDGPDHFEALKEELGQLTWPEVVAFQSRFDEAMAAANTIDLEGAAYLINGGEHGNEGFRDFRAWLVGRGRPARSEEHTSELQSLTNLVCRLLPEKKKKQGIA